MLHIKITLPGVYLTVFVFLTAEVTPDSGHVQHNIIVPVCECSCVSYRMSRRSVTMSNITWLVCVCSSVNCLRHIVGMSNIILHAQHNATLPNLVVVVLVTAYVTSHWPWQT